MVEKKARKSKGKPRCAFGARMRLHRMRLGLDQGTIGRRIGLSRRMVAYYEIESEVPPTGDIVAKLARLFGVSCDYLLDAASPRESDTVDLPTDVRQIKRLLQIRRLPRGIQRALFLHIDALLASVRPKKRAKKS